MKGVSILAAVLFILSPVLAIKYTDCGSGSDVTGVEVTGCEGLDVCPLKRGTDVTLTIKFNSKSTSKTLTTVVHGIIAGVPMPFPVPQPDACNGSGVNCPLDTGKSYVYTNALDIKKSYPPLSVEVKWELKDENSNDVVCVKLPAKLT